MERCDICGKECKTGQGLGGHKRWVHGVAPSGAQLRLEQPNPLITKSALEQLLDERFAAISEQVDALSGELAEQVKTLSGEQQQGEKQDERIAQLEQRLVAAERKTIDDFTSIEKAQFIIPWMQELSGEDFVKLSLKTGHDAQLVEVPDPEAQAALTEIFRQQAEEQKEAENPKIIEGKTDKPGYIYYEYLNLSMRE